MGDFDASTLQARNFELIVSGDFLKKVLPRIAAAARSIDILIFDFRVPRARADAPVSRFLNGLKAARDRGVRVRILTPNAGVCAALVKMGFQARQIYSTKIMHVKMLLIDDTELVIGSHNYTRSAFTLNTELSIAVSLPSPQNDAAALFSNLYRV